MSLNHSNILEYFQLKPVRSAKVSEISEATAASAVPVEERVNFHIGHPVQDEKLEREYFRLVTGLQSPLSTLNSEDHEYELRTNGWERNTTSRLAFFQEIIAKIAPYLPRGGYIRNAPGPLIEYLEEWLTTGQAEPLSYEFGQNSPQRECMLHTGGIWESLRFLFQSLSTFLVHLPARILLYNVDLPNYLSQISDLIFIQLPKAENDAFKQINNLFNTQPVAPTFLILGSVMSETARRKLRLFSLNHPLLFVEINEAPNHLSLAREAKMQNRVIRILTAKTLLPNSDHLATGFILGNADLIKIMETVQFELKGTPSVTEIDLLTYLIQNKQIELGQNSGLNNKIITVNTTDPLRQTIIFDKHTNPTLEKLKKINQ